MGTIVAPVTPAQGGSVVGPIVLIFVLLFLLVGLIVVVRLLLIRLRRSFPSPKRDREVPTMDEETDDESSRVLKARYLRGEISKAQYDARLRRIQLRDYLKSDR